MFPKQTQLQNNTLNIQTPLSTISFRASSPPRIMASSSPLPIDEESLVVRKKLLVTEGVGIMAGLMPRRITEPARPTPAERRKPDLDRSMSHQRRGLTRARVIET
jgi:hypothetical protein